MNHRDHAVLIIDNGLFVSLTLTLRESFGKVFYWSEYAGPFPRSAESAIGTGYDGVKRVEDQTELYKVLGTDKENLLVLFADSYYGGMQADLRSQGYRVWGPGPGEWIELDRYKTYDMFESLGIPMPKTVKLTGTDKLKAYLKANENVYVKARYARVRGDFETHKCESWALAEDWFTFDLESKLSAGQKETTEFIVSHAIPDAVEISSERYLVDRQFPSVCMFSMEVKGDGAVSKVLPTNKFPTQITEIDKVLVQESWAAGYRAPFTIETRVTKDGTPYPIDPCCRFGRPSWGTVSANTKNLGDISWMGAEGVMVDPDYHEEWVVELMIENPKVGGRGASLLIPDEVRPYVFLSDAYYSRGLDRVTAQDISNIGSVVGLGSSLDAAIKQCLDRADKIKGDGICLHKEAFDKAKDNLEQLAEHGIEI